MAFDNERCAVQITNADDDKSKKVPQRFFLRAF